MKDVSDLMQKKFFCHRKDLPEENTLLKTLGNMICSRTLSQTEF